MIRSNYKNKILNSIVISGWPAVGKTTIATELAKEFGYKHYNGGDVLKMLAAEKGYVGIQKKQKISWKKENQILILILKSIGNW